MTSEAMHAGHRHEIPLVPLGFSLSIFLTITFVLCAIGNLIPGLEGVHFLSALYPNVDWTKPAPLIAGVIWAIFTGWYVALVFGSLYNLFCRYRR
jgi:hypothetical protein